jgi:hypothetical protein
VDGIAPDAVGVIKLDRRQSEARSEEFIKAWEAARLPDVPAAPGVR